MFSRPSSPDPEVLRRDGIVEPESVPSQVLAARCFLQRLGVWHQFSRNAPALSCRDAANKRYRLGHIGIPLCDELKSFLGRFENSAGITHHVAVHCRGDCELDLTNLSAIVGARGAVTRLSARELEELGMAYGLVTPFAAYELDAALLSLPILHVWDEDVLRPSAPPGTMVTNAGHHTWAVEFVPREFIRRVESETTNRIVIGRFSRRESDAPARPLDRPRGCKIAILTGNAPESGIRLWSLMNERIRLRLGTRCHGDVSMPSVDVFSLPELGLTMELDQREAFVWPIIEAAACRALEAGAAFLALACHTSHYFTPQLRELCEARGSEFISMPEVVGAWVQQQGLSRIGIIGIRFVAELGKWSAYRAALGDAMVEIPSGDRLEEIAALAYRVKTEGVTSAGITRLRDLIRTSVDCDTIVLALTELSLLMDQLRLKGRGRKILIDPIELYADALAARFVNDG